MKAYKLSCFLQIKNYQLSTIHYQLIKLSINNMANISYKHFTIGVEEEYMVIDPETRELKSHEQKIVQEGQKVIKDKVKAEMHQAVVEVGTDICQDVDEAFMDVSTLRKTISGIGESLGFKGWCIRHSSFQPLGKPVDYRPCTVQ